MSMNKLDLMEQRMELINQMKSILNRCKTEKRELLKVEDEEFHSLKEQVEQIDIQIINNRNKEIKKSKNMNSIFRNLKQNNIESQAELRAQLRKNGLEVADNEYILNVRAVSPTGGADLEPTQVADVMPQLAEQSFVAQAGGHVVSVPATFVIPTMDGMSLSWEDEDGEETTATGVSVNATKLELKRLSGAFACDKKMIDVVSPSLEAAIEQSIYNLIDAKTNEKIIDAISATTQTVTAASGETNYSVLTKAEGNLIANGVKPQNIVYLYSAKDLNMLKAVSRGNNQTRPVLDDDNTIGGHKAIASAYIPTGTVYCVDGTAIWLNMPYIGLLLDPYTLSSKGQSRIVVNAYGDANVANLNKYVAKCTITQTKSN